MPRPRGSADPIKDARRRAPPPLTKGGDYIWTHDKLRLQTLMRWRAAGRRRSAKACEARFLPGRPWELTEGQRRRLLKPLLEGKITYRYATTARMAA